MSDCYEEMQEAQRRLDKARRANLVLILAELRTELAARVRYLHDALFYARDASQNYSAACPDIASLTVELRQLEDEFGALTIDRQESFLEVATEPIALEGIPLGAFALRLYWNRLRDESGVGCFDVLALEPNPASNNDGVTHPHVKDESLCPGEATVALRTALDQGRLADAFCLIRSVLNNYNPGSAYVRLEQWNGQECYDCGNSYLAGEGGYCESCHNDYCEACARSCATCGQNGCSGCLNFRAICNDDFCNDCLSISERPSRRVCGRCQRTCPVCSVRVATDEYDEQAQLCLACMKRRPTGAVPPSSLFPDPENQDASSLTTSDAA